MPYAAILYRAALSASILGNPKNWTGGVLAITMIVAAILDAD
ncbi:hypothetical protein [Streptomyces scopuliridis]